MAAVHLGPTQVDAEVLQETAVEVVAAHARRVRDDGRLALLPHRPVRASHPPTDRPGLLDLESLVESIGDCAAVPLATARVPGPFPLLMAAPFPCLLGDPAGIDALADQAGVHRGGVCRSRPTRTDFLDVVTSWCGPDDEETPEQVRERLLTETDHASVMAHEIGAVIAEGHLGGVLLGDNRRSSFAMATDGLIKILDYDPRFLYWPPTPAQCATDLAPLLSSLSGPQWRAFRLGYLHGWADARPVLDLIEFGDTTGWMLPFARRQFAVAAARLKPQLAACPPDDTLSQLALSASLAYAQSLLDRHTEACAAADVAVETAAAVAPQLLPILQLHAGLARLRAGQPEAAARILVTLLGGARTPTLKSLAARALSATYAGQPQPPDDDLPFFARRGPRIDLLQLFGKDRQ
jgi:hypothetical protein